MLNLMTVCVYRQNTKGVFHKMSSRKKFIESCETVEHKTYMLGGYEQKVLVEGKKADNPLVIYLHGGPGNPIPFGEGCSGLFPELEEKCTMVYWDQLGCGINDTELDDSICIESYVTMSIDLIKALHKDYPKNKICLFGVSWGSVLAARCATEIPELLDKVMVYGQITKELFFNDEVFAALEKNASDMSKSELEAYERVKKSKVPRTDSDIADMGNLIKKCTDGYHNPNGGKTPVGKFVVGMLTSPDYHLKDFKAVFDNGTHRKPIIIRQLMDIDMRDTLAKIKLPYLIVQGSSDLVTSTNTIRDYLSECPNENIRFKVIPNSGHMPSGEAMQYLMEEGMNFLSEKIAVRS